jgi:NAD(P)-dependent dehydrogenase (short-subunit alcohol dehydrogenase family)
VKVSGSKALVTGANRGLGCALVQALRQAGCAKIYATAREPASIPPSDGIEPIQLDITKSEDVAAAAARCHDIDLLINNAGVGQFSPLLGAPTMDHARLNMETNYFGTLAMCRAFAPVLKRSGGGCLVNVLSVSSWFNTPMLGSYSASKAAEWSLTKGVRCELRGQGTLVIGVYAGYIDTDMTVSLRVPKSSTSEIAAHIVEGIANCKEEILADQMARSYHAERRKDEAAIDAKMQKLWDNRLVFMRRDPRTHRT